MALAARHYAFGGFQKARGSRCADHALEAEKAAHIASQLLD
jgi:hypothetical protein